MQAFLFRHDHSARIEHRRLKRAAFYRCYTSSRACTHGNACNVLGRKTVLFDEHGGETIFTITDQSDRNLLAFQISDAFDARMHDKKPSYFFRLIEDRLQLRSFRSGAQSAAAGAAEIDVAAEQRGDRRGPADSDRFVLQAFIFEKTFGFGGVDGEIIETRARHGGADQLSTRGGCECQTKGC